MANFTIKIEQMQSAYQPEGTINTQHENEEFKCIKAARKFIKEMIKKYDLEKHHDYIVNYSTQLELTTNF